MAAFCRLHFNSQDFNLLLQHFVFRHFPPQELCGQLRLLCHPCRGQQICIPQLMGALSKVVNLHPPLVHQRLKTKIDAAKADAQLFGQSPLTDVRRFLQTAQHLEPYFLLETGQSLVGRCKAQGNSGTLPPCRCAISKCVLRPGLTGGEGSLKLHGNEGTTTCSTDEHNFATDF